jgi:RNA polymerase sigma-70 factor (ECF subfamily)
LNVAISFARKSSPKCSSIDDLETIDIAEEGQSDIKTLYELIGLLAEEDQALLFLYIDGKTHQEIAEIMGMSTSNVGNKVQRLKLKLKLLNDE